MRVGFIGTHVGTRPVSRYCILSNGGKQRSDLLSRLIVRAGEQLRAEGRSSPAPLEATSVLPRLGIPPAPRLQDGGQTVLDATQLDAVRCGRYVVVGELGHGSAGDVFEAYDPELRRDVAVKVLRKQHTDPEVLGRFVTEAQVTDVFRSDLSRRRVRARSGRRSS